MSTTIQELKSKLEARDLSGFLDIYESMVRSSSARPPEFTGITQRLLPPILRDLLHNECVSAGDLMRIYQLIRSCQLLVVDDTILDGINCRLGTAWAIVKQLGEQSPPPLSLYKEACSPKRRAQTSQQSEGCTPMRRIVISSVFQLGPVHISDALSFKKNLCASSQEREFLKAIRQFFPNFRAYPNVPLRNFLDVDGFILRLSDRHHSYVWGAQVDVLLCTEDEDPIAGFELDSIHHDAGKAMERDGLKDDLFATAGIPLMRIRADETSHVRAEDFFDMLVADEATLEKLRPRRLRPRRNHDALVPAQTI